MKYSKLINQEPYLCVPTCLQMIFERRGLKVDKTQLDLGFMLNFTIDRETSMSSYEYYKEKGFEIPEPKDKKNAGCVLIDLNTQIFQPLGLNLTEDYFTTSSYRGIFSDEDLIKRFTKECSKLLKSGDKDVMLAVNYRVLAEENPYTQKMSAHLMLLEKIEDDVFYYISPETAKDGGTCREKASATLMYYAFKSQNRGNVTYIFEKEGDK